MGGRLSEGLTMAEWEDELERWLKPFLDRLGHKTRQRMCPLYVAGLIGPGDRKSVQPMAERLATGNYDQLHHFIADGVGTRHRWNRNCSIRRTGLSAARMPAGY
jgi:SRSO17 transposase